MELVKRSEPERRPSVHLMTNGENLEPRFFRRAADSGLKSLLVSLDGLSSQSHDWLRSGSRIEVLGARIAEVSRVRRSEGLDVRLGISWTIHRRNLHELPALLACAVGWGLDVIKLEEMHPVGALADELGKVEQSRVDPVIHAVLEEAKQLGIVVANHFNHRRTPRCLIRTDPSLAEACLADDYANRSSIDPCQDPYQTIFVDPDGTVKPGSFSHRGAGNLLESPLSELWNNSEFQGWRRIAGRKRICASRINCHREGAQ
jgi:MoaA/NifB/PqqE/SkfB family radical SAM enzyme